MMVACKKIAFEQLCRIRGFAVEEVDACVVACDGDHWTIDVDHPAYPREPKRGFVLPQPAESPHGGPGTELSRLLKRFGINPTPTCQCRAKAREMDAWGPDECEKPERIEEVLGVMREEAKARGLPFLDAAGRMLIRRAIANARRAAKN